MPRWNLEEGSKKYEAAVHSLLIVLTRANGFVSHNPHCRGLFAGKRIKARKIYKGYNENLRKESS